MKSKILLLILTTVLCVSLIPITVLAETEPTELESMELQPTDIEPTELQPTEIEPTEVAPTELESTELQPSDYSLTVSLTHDWDDEVRLENVIEYTYYVKNTGTKTYYYVVVTDADIMGKYTHTIPQLAPEEEWKTTKSRLVNEKDIKTGYIDNTLTAIGDEVEAGKRPQGEATVRINTTSEAPNPKIDASMTFDSTPSNGACYGTGDKVAYKVTIQNTGNLTVKKVQLESSLSDIAISSVSQGTASVNGSVITLDSKISPLASVDVVFTHTVAKDELKAGAINSVDNTVKVKGETTYGNVNKTTDKLTYKTKSLLTIKAKDSLNNQYTGKTIKSNKYTNTELMSGDKIKSVTIDGGQTEIGYYENELVPSAAVIANSEGKTVTDYYEISYAAGDLEIVAQAAGGSLVKSGDNTIAPLFLTVLEILSCLLAVFVWRRRPLK